MLRFGEVCGMKPQSSKLQSCHVALASAVVLGMCDSCWLEIRVRSEETLVERQWHGRGPCCQDGLQLGGRGVSETRSRCGRDLVDAQSDRPGLHMVCKPPSWRLYASTPLVPVQCSRHARP